MSLKSSRISISSRRQAWVVRWINELLEGGEITADFESELGRLSFVCRAVVFDRLFCPRSTRMLPRHEARLTGKRLARTCRPKGSS